MKCRFIAARVSRKMRKCNCLRRQFNVYCVVIDYTIHFLWFEGFSWPDIRCIRLSHVKTCKYGKPVDHKVPPAIMVCASITISTDDGSSVIDDSHFFYSELFRQFKFLFSHQNHSSCVCPSGVWCRFIFPFFVGQNWLYDWLIADYERIRAESISISMAQTLSQFPSLSPRLIVSISLVMDCVKVYQLSLHAFASDIFFHFVCWNVIIPLNRWAAALIRKLSHSARLKWNKIILKFDFVPVSTHCQVPTTN